MKCKMWYDSEMRSGVDVCMGRVGRSREVLRMTKGISMRWVRLGIFMLLGIAAAGCAPQPKTEDTPKSTSSTKAADEAYVTFRNTHENSPKIPGMIVRLVKQHMEAGEYLLARFYCDEYRRDFPSGRQRDEIEYLRIKAGMLHAKKEQNDRQMEQVKAEARQFLAVFRTSPFRAKVQKILETLRAEQNSRYEELARYYEKKGKPKAAAFYREKIEKN